MGRIILTEGIFGGGLSAFKKQGDSSWYKEVKAGKESILVGFEYKLDFGTEAICLIGHKVKKGKQTVLMPLKNIGNPGAASVVDLCEKFIFGINKELDLYEPVQVISIQAPTPFLKP